jgi:hypothetical protein
VGEGQPPAVTSNWEIAAAIGTMLAAGGAGWAALVAARSARSSEAFLKLETERRVDERQAAGVANVGASLRKSSLGPGPVSVTVAMAQHRWLRVWNQGPAVATEVAIACDEEDFIADPTELPRILRPGQPVDVWVGGDRLEATPLVTISWVDGNGSQHLEVGKVFLEEP